MFRNVFILINDPSWQSRFIFIFTSVTAIDPHATSANPRSFPVTERPLHLTNGSLQPLRLPELTKGSGLPCKHFLDAVREDVH